MKSTLSEVANKLWAAKRQTDRIYRDLDEEVASQERYNLLEEETRRTVERILKDSRWSIEDLVIKLCSKVFENPTNLTEVVLFDLLEEWRKGEDERKMSVKNINRYFRNKEVVVAPSGWHYHMEGCKMTLDKEMGPYNPVTYKLGIRNKGGRRYLPCFCSSRVYMKELGIGEKSRL